MSKQQRDAINAALRAEPFNLKQTTAEHRKSFDAFAIRPYPADVAAAGVTLGGVSAIELTVAGNDADLGSSGGTSASPRPSGKPDQPLPGRSGMPAGRGRREPL